MDQKIWRGLVGGLLGVLLTVGSFFGAWGFMEIQDIPKVYETKNDHDRDLTRIEKRQTTIIEKVDDGFDNVNEKLFDIVEKLK